MYSDQCNCSIAIDNKMADLWEPLEPHYNIFIPTRPHEVSNCITIPKPVIATFSNWLADQTPENPSADKVARFNAIPSL